MNLNSNILHNLLFFSGEKLCTSSVFLGSSIAAVRLLTTVFLLIVEINKWKKYILNFGFTNDGGKFLENYLFANAEWEISIFNHVEDLTFHGQNKENKPIDQQYWPEDRDVKHGEEGH